MQASTKLFAVTTLAAFAAFGSAAASAEDWNGGGTEAIGQSTSLSATVGNVSSDEVNAGAMAAARPSGTEATGQSTAMPMPTSSPTAADEAYRDAVAASHASGTEAIGQSTAMPMPRSSGS